MCTSAYIRLCITQEQCLSSFLSREGGTHISKCPLAKIDAAFELCGKVRELEMQRSGLRSCREEGKQNLDPGFPSEHNARSMIIPGAERLLSIDIQEAPLRYAWQKLKRNFTTEL